MTSVCKIKRRVLILRNDSRMRQNRNKREKKNYYFAVAPEIWTRDKVKSEKILYQRTCGDDIDIYT